MPIIQCDIRNGRTKEQRSALAKGLTAIVQKYTGCEIDHVFLVMREMPGFNFVDAGRTCSGLCARARWSGHRRRRAVASTRCKSQVLLTLKDSLCPYIQVELQAGLEPAAKKAMVAEIVTHVNATIGSSRAHINVAVIELPPENLAEAGEPARIHSKR